MQVLAGKNDSERPLPNPGNFVLKKQIACGLSFIGGVTRVGYKF